MEIPESFPQATDADGRNNRHPILDIDPDALANCSDVIESLLSNPATRAAWLLGFLTGSALVDANAPITPIS
jgi:hypothetical protein